MSYTSPPIENVFPKVDSALSGLLHDGMSIMSGGFGLCGNAEACIEAIARSRVKNLTIISNNCGNQGQGLAVLLKNRQVSRVICSFVGGNPDLADLYLKGLVKVELSPQRTFAERISAGGAGIAGFYTPTGVGTVVQEGKEVREFGGRKYLLEQGLTADFAFVKAWKGDRWGNLIYRKTARNFNPVMATAADYVIAEVEELVELGQLDPNQVHTPGIFVDALFQGPKYEKRIERRTTRK